ncbi:MAG: class II fructose-bisphosphate aldolase [Candidatus Brocadia sp.]|jgi:fructose/tagatose bisphosphate aldolase
MLYHTEEDLLSDIKGIIDIQKDGAVKITDKDALRNKKIDNIVYNAVFNKENAIKDVSRRLIRNIGNKLGIVSSSIQSLYEAMGRKEYKGFTVPAINIRGLTYDVSRSIFRAAKKNHVGAFIFEIARSEIGYTDQRPAEYATAILAAAIKEGFEGPVFIQGDHFQINAKKYEKDKDGEINTVKKLIKEAIDAGFYNIDIDTSTLVDLNKPSLSEQQRLNFEFAAELTAYIRSLEPKGITISVGGEIGEVGKKNSTVEELRAFMDGYNTALAIKGKGMKGISKISVQTGTTHGGVPLPDGTIARVKLDFETLENLSRVARDEYGLSGAVQHGASTLPPDAFDKFPETGTAEVHLATEFQNMIYESSVFPQDFKKEIYDFLKNHPDIRKEWKEGDTEEQFLYKVRKNGFGPFKEKFWNLPADVRNRIGEELEVKFEFLFKKLNVIHSKEIINKTIKPVEVPLPDPPGRV